MDLELKNGRGHHVHDRFVRNEFRFTG